MEYTDKMRKIGNRIKKERLKYGFSEQDKLCEKLSGDPYYISITRQTLSKIERGLKTSRAFDVDLLVALADIFECEVQYLLCEQDCKRRKVQNIQDLTGLSEAACDALGSLQPEEKALINGFFEDNLMKDVLKIINDYFFNNPDITTNMRSQPNSNFNYEYERNGGYAFDNISIAYDYKLDERAKYLLRSLVFNRDVFNHFFFKADKQQYNNMVELLNEQVNNADNEEEAKTAQEELEDLQYLGKEFFDISVSNNIYTGYGYNDYVDNIKAGYIDDNRGKHTGKF